MGLLWEIVVAPWTWGDWMWRGMLASSLAAVTLAVLGVFLYLRHMSMLADALAHVALPGIVGAFLVSGSLDPLVMLAGAAVTGVAASASIAGLSRLPNIRSDAAIGIVFTSMFAAGVILISTTVQDAHIDTQCVLFGNVLAISDRSLLLLGTVAPVTLVLVGVFYRWLAVTSFDPTLAVSLGVPTVAVHYGLMTTTSVATVASFEAVGAILGIAMIIVPAATAHLLADRLPTMLAVAVGHAILSSTLGMYTSIWLDSSAAGAIVCVGGVLYALTFLFAPRYGLVFRWWRRRSTGGTSRRLDGAETES